jgi:predicted nucleotidyltransferase
MLITDEAFRKFRSKLELTQKEQDDASRRQKEIRSVMDEAFKIQHDFLTGSYKRWTKTKPLKDVDIFCVLHDDERPKYRDGKSPSILLDEVDRVMVKRYGRSNVSKQRRSITVEFTDSQDEERVMSFDVVPAFAVGDPDKGGHYEIPDTATVEGWTHTDPRVHADKATAANQAFSGEWKGMVRMVKAWNRAKGKPVKPSFLLEVMALDILRPPFGGDFPYEFMAFFATAADRIHEEWPEPAGLGPPVSDAMDATARELAKRELTAAHYAIREAVELSRSGRQGEALRKYKDIFGDLFPLS